MKTFSKWLKENCNCEMPKGDIDAEWFISKGLPMVVECTCCQMTMALPSAYIDGNDNIYCSACAKE